MTKIRAIFGVMALTATEAGLPGTEAAARREGRPPLRPVR
jgi:hypothetical protein